MRQRTSLSHPIAGMLGPVNAVGVLAVFTVLILAVPSELTIGPLGGAGSPAQVLCLGMLGWWICVAAAARGESRGCVQPVRIAMCVFTVAVFVSYLAMALRPTNGTEARAGDTGLVSVCAWLGLVLILADGVPTRQHLDLVLRRMVTATSTLATFGVIQFVTKQSYINDIHIPGLRENQAAPSLMDRGGLVRIAGTALSPIEFGAVLTMVLPLALHYAFSDTGKSQLRRWYPVATIAAAIPISISRSAVLSFIVVTVIVLPTYEMTRRRRVLATLIGGLFVAYIITPGLLGTILALFTAFSSDSSTTSRTGSFTLAFIFIGRAPLFGRGIGTFLPAYRILDDQYLHSLIETGLFGLGSLLALFATGVREGFVIRRSSADPATRSLANALAASIASVSLSFATFDAFSFPMAATLCFFMLGAVAALKRVSGSPDVVAELPMRAMASTEHRELSAV